MSANNVTPSRIFAATLYSLVTASLCAEAVAASVSAKAAIHEATRANEANVFPAHPFRVSPRSRILRRCSASGQLHPRKLLQIADREPQIADCNSRGWQHMPMKCPRNIQSALNVVVGGVSKVRRKTLRGLQPCSSAV